MIWLSEWLKDNDVLVKLLLAAAAPGGVWFWIDKYRNRTHIILREIYFSPEDNILGDLILDIENIGLTLTSLEPEFKLTGYKPNRQKISITLKILGEERQLPPFSVQRFLASADQPERDLQNLWFVSVKLRLSRGGGLRIRWKNALLEQMSLLRFDWEKFLFLRFGKLD